MSFSSQVKDELNALAIKNNCCKKAYIFGVMLSASALGDVISVKLTDESTAEQFCHFLKSIYNIEPERKAINRGCFKAFELSFRSHKISEFLSFADSFSDSDEDIDALSSFFKCKDCKSVFLRAVFCARGSVSDPKKSYSLEIHVPNDTRAMLVHSILEELGPEAPGITPRKDGYGIFYRNESAIEYVLSVFGANKIIFDFLDAYVEKDYRNAENRATNCVARNIARSVNAAGAQIASIEALIANGMLEELSEDIKTTAKLRIANPDMSLGELAAIHNPPISKSGLNHRLSKITELAKKRKLI
ncbi:MAG: DNA-binding protein WhiA [Ruminococcaceae bacterium]|nr:DNA-binding protein WhiA [Oscillospiraceae bacterium]